MQAAKFRQKWGRRRILLAVAFGVLAESHLASVVVLAAMGSAPAQYYTEAAYLGAWSLVLVGHSPLPEIPGRSR